MCLACKTHDAIRPSFMDRGLKLKPCAASLSTLPRRNQR